MTAVPAVRAGLLLALAAGAACGGSGSSHADGLPGLRFARADVVAAQQGAPDLYARAQRARSDALAADEPEARSEHAQRARLWLAAALAEAQRIAHARATSEAEARVAAAEQRRAQLVRDRLELEARGQRASAAEQARVRVVKALALADEDASGRAALASDGDRDQAAKALRERAALLSRAAEQLSGPVDAGLAEPAHGAATSGSRRGRRSLSAARQQLQRALDALGAARARQALPPSAAEHAALLELAAEHGLAPVPAERGLVFTLQPASGALFAGGQLERPGRVLVARIGDVLRAHPHGPVQLEAPAGATAGEARLARSRGERVAGVLASAVGRERVRVVAAAAGAAWAVVLPAYVLAPAPAPAPASVR